MKSKVSYVPVKENKTVTYSDRFSRLNVLGPHYIENILHILTFIQVLMRLIDWKKG